MRKCGVVLGALGVAFVSFMAVTPASARNLYFDIWCQEQGYEKDRCDQRLPADVAAFEEYWRAVEKYEHQYYTERQAYLDFRDELNTLDESHQVGPQGYDPDSAIRTY